MIAQPTEDRLPDILLCLPGHLPGQGLESHAVEL